MAGCPRSARSRHADDGRLAGGRVPGSSVARHATLAPGRRPEPSRLRAGRRARGTPAVTPAPGKPLDPIRDTAGPRASTARGPGTPVPGRPLAVRPGPGGPVRDSSPTPVSRIRASPTQGAPDRRRCATPAASGGQAARSSGSATARCLTRRPGQRGPIAAIETDNVAAFARDLRVLRSKAGLDYPDMAEKSHYTMRTLASAAGGLGCPRCRCSSPTSTPATATSPSGKSAGAG